MVNTFILTVTWFFYGVPGHSREDFCSAVLRHPFIDKVRSCWPNSMLENLAGSSSFDRRCSKNARSTWQLFQHIGMEQLNVLTAVRISAYRPLGGFLEPILGCKWELSAYTRNCRAVVVMIVVWKMPSGICITAS